MSKKNYKFSEPEIIERSSIDKLLSEDEIPFLVFSIDMKYGHLGIAADEKCVDFLIQAKGVDSLKDVVTTLLNEYLDKKKQ
jgi:hypothetical protein